MNDKEIEKIKKQHFESYRESILFNLENNSKTLIKEDIYSLIKKPPLDSMDLIKNKFLDISKNNKIVLNNEDLNSVLDEYRNNIIDKLDDLIKKRVDYFSKVINKYKRKDDSTCIRILKKDFVDFDKIMKKDLKNIIDNNMEIIINNLNIIFGDSYSKKIDSSINKFLKKDYYKSLFENIDIKIMVKDATLINNINEETERYQFTLENSRLFK